MAPTFDRGRMGLHSPAKIDSYRGFVFACFDPAAVDLRTYLAGAADYIDLVADQAESLEIVPGAHEYSADANWKLFVENSLDGYHLLPVHTTYFEYLEKVEGSRPEPRQSRRGHRPRQRARGSQGAGAVGAAGGPLVARPRGAEPRPGRGRLRRAGPQARAGAGRFDRPGRSATW